MALPSSLVWEVRSSGSDLNAGCFDAASLSTGTDYSQADAPLGGVYRPRGKRGGCNTGHQLSDFVFLGACGERNSSLGGNGVHPGRLCDSERLRGRGYARSSLRNRWILGWIRTPGRGAGDVLAAGGRHGGEESSVRQIGRLHRGGNRHVFSEFGRIESIKPTDPNHRLRGHALGLRYARTGPADSHNRRLRQRVLALCGCLGIP